MISPPVEESSKPVKPIIGSSPPPPDGSSTFIAMRHRNFQLYFAGQLVSNIGAWMQIIAQGWVAYQIGHSELTLGLVAFASAVPNLIISPWGGVVVDRVFRRKALIMTQAGAMILAFILAALAFANVVREGT
jgi:MFS family permease